MKIIIPTRNRSKLYTKAFIDTKVKESLDDIIKRRKNARRNARLVQIITR